jgi:hypothetical protein
VGNILGVQLDSGGKYSRVGIYKSGSKYSRGAIKLGWERTTRVGKNNSGRKEQLGWERTTRVGKNNLDRKEQLEWERTTRVGNILGWERFSGCN